MMWQEKSLTDFPEELRPLISSLKHFTTTLTADLMEVLFRLNLTVPQIRVLHAIRKEGRKSGRQLARELGVSPGAVVQVCDRLQEQGYLERVPDKDDRRVTWFQLTSSTQNLFEEMLALRRSRLLPALQRLSEADRENLIRMLNSMSAVLESERDRDPNAAAAIERLTSREPGDGSLEPEPAQSG
jgi:DNA-binding MarR family transcriptional regulator